MSAPKVNKMYHYIGDDQKLYRVVAITKPAGILGDMLSELVVVYQYENPPDDYVGHMQFSRTVSDFERRMVDA